MSRLVGFTVVYTVLMAVYGNAVDSPLTGLYTGLNIGLFLLFALLHRWAEWPLRALWALSFVGLGNMAGGVFLVEGEPLYLAEIVGSLRYDKVFHAFAAFAFVMLAWEAVKRWSGGIHHLGGQLLLTWLVVMGGGAVVEIGELIGSSLSEVSVGDYANNALDLVANGFGVLVGVGLVWRAKKRVDPPT